MATITKEMPEGFLAAAQLINEGLGDKLPTGEEFRLYGITVERTSDAELFLTCPEWECAFTVKRAYTGTR